MHGALLGTWGTLLWVGVSPNLWHLKIGKRESYPSVNYETRQSVINSVTAPVSPEAWGNTREMAVVSSLEGLWWFHGEDGVWLVPCKMNRTLTDRYGRKRHSVLGRACSRAQAWKCICRMFLEQVRHGGARWKVWLGRWVECRLNSLNSHGQESELVRNICKSHVVGTVRCWVVSDDSSLLSPTYLLFYLAGRGWARGGFGRCGDRTECLAQLFTGSFRGTIAPGLFLVLAGQPLPPSPPFWITYPVGPPKAETHKLHRRGFHTVCFKCHQNPRPNQFRMFHCTCHLFPGPMGLWGLNISV